MFLAGQPVDAKQESLPLLDSAVPPLRASTPEMTAKFGYTMAMGKLGDALTDTRDDLLVCAINEDEGGVMDVGAAYVFLDANLQPPPDPLIARLIPKLPHDDEPDWQMGRLDAQIGNIRGLKPATGLPYDNLIMIGCQGREADYPGRGTVQRAGSVEVFDIFATGFDGHAQLSLLPPLNPVIGPSPLEFTVPNEVKGFGHGLAVGDVTRDGVDDLIVGAIDTNTLSGPSRNHSGRIYIFQGQADFFGDVSGTADPYFAWVGIDAPEPSTAGEFSGSSFGADVEAVNLDADEAVEVIVGRTDRYQEATSNQPRGGTAYLFRGLFLHNLFDGMLPPAAGTLNRVNTPPAVDGLDPIAPEYQVLTNPFGTPEEYSDWYGWQVFSIGDMGSPGGGLPDGFPDIAIHPEATDYIGTGELSNPQIDDVGGVFVYFGVDPDGPDSPGMFVRPEHVLLQTPSNVGTPELLARFGRDVAGIQWFNSETGMVEAGLLVGEPDRTVQGLAKAGAVYLYRAPLCPDLPNMPGVCDPPVDPLLEPYDALNAWGSNPLVEPYEHPVQVPVAVGYLFGAAIVVGDYKGNPVLFPGEQFIVSSRAANVEDASQVVREGAGAAYAFVPPPASP